MGSRRITIMTPTGSLPPKPETTRMLGNNAKATLPLYWKLLGVKRISASTNTGGCPSHSPGECSRSRSFSHVMTTTKHVLGLERHPGLNRPLAKFYPDLAGNNSELCFRRNRYLLCTSLDPSRFHFI